MYTYLPAHPPRQPSQAYEGPFEPICLIFARIKEVIGQIYTKIKAISAPKISEKPRSTDVEAEGILG